MSEFLCRSRGQSDLCSTFFVRFKELGVRVTERSALLRLLILLGMLKHNSFFALVLLKVKTFRDARLLLFVFSLHLFQCLSVQHLPNLNHFGF